LLLAENVLAVGPPLATLARAWLELVRGAAERPDVSEYTVKAAHFQAYSRARQLTDAEVSTMAGTPGTARRCHGMAPEIRREVRRIRAAKLAAAALAAGEAGAADGVLEDVPGTHTLQHDMSVDVYSLGTLYLDMRCGGVRIEVANMRQRTLAY
jgi:hypothetical protein